MSLRTFLFRYQKALLIIRKSTLFLNYQTSEPVYYRLTTKIRITSLVLFRTFSLIAIERRSLTYTRRTSRIKRISSLITMQLQTTRNYSIASLLILTFSIFSKIKIETSSSISLVLLLLIALRQRRMQILSYQGLISLHLYQRYTNIS